MNLKINLILAIIIALNLGVVAYILNYNRVLEHQLFDNRKECEARIIDLHESHNLEVDKILREIDRRNSMQVSAVAASTSNNTTDQYKKVDNIAKLTLERFDESIEHIVERKYRFLFSNLSLGNELLKELRLLLLEREDIALMISDAKEFEEESGISKDEIWKLESALEDIDVRVEQLLDSDNSQRYVMLKNSDEEQHHFTQYALGINGLFPLNNKQQEAVLLTRLKHKQAFEEALNASGIHQDYPLTQEQSKSLLKDLEMAAMRYKHGYLMEIHGKLDHDSFPMDQYTLLENSINTEFKQLIDSLREKVAQRGIIN